MMLYGRRKLLACALAGAIAALSGHAIAATEQQAKDMVSKAMALYDQAGEAAFATFNQQGSGFRDGDVYIIVQSRGPGARVLAHAANPKLVGTPLADIADPTGLKFGEQMSAEATETGGWFEYKWPDPETGQVGQKRSWAVLHKDLVFIAGIYIR